jgi:hypothetical protein
MAGVLAAGMLVCGWPQAASAEVTLAIAPRSTSVRQLADAGLSPGVLSAGIGEVSAAKTYEDISAGNRDRPPSDATPGLLEATLARAGLSAHFRRVRIDSVGLAALVGTLRGADLLIVLAAPPPAENHALPVGIAGAGFHGTLTSDSTRTDGYVLSTDLAPTVLSRLGVSIPGAMNGEPIHTEGTDDPASVDERAERMTAVADRRIPVVVGCLGAWLVLALAVGLAVSPLRRAAAAWAGLSFAYMPLLLLAGAALEPTAAVEGLLVGIGAALLAALTLLVARGWWAAAIACAITVGAYALDMVTGSELSKLSLLGPNPVYGARFYGIGNELEALFAVMVPVGVGAALAAVGETRRAEAAFLLAGGVAAVIFAAGRFGADVGAAIVLALGAAVAAVAVSKSGKRANRRLLWAVPAAPLFALGALALIDLVSGGNAHLTRSVLDAGGAGDLGDAAERRLRLSVHDFSQAAGNPLFWLVVAGIAFAAVNWRTIDAWLRPAPLARAGVIGACAAVAAGVLVNDSGATFLVLGSLGLGASLAFAWAQAPARIRSNPRNSRVPSG